MAHAITIAATGQALIHGALDLAGSMRMRDVLAAADLAVANLEATASVPGAWPTKTKTLHLTGPAGVGSLAGLGLSVLTHANNHAFDLGPPGIVRTREVVAAAGLGLAGSGGDVAEALAPAWRATRGARSRCWRSISGRSRRSSMRGRGARAWRRCGCAAAWWCRKAGSRCCGRL